MNLQRDNILIFSRQTHSSASEAILALKSSPGLLFATFPTEGYEGFQGKFKNIFRKQMRNMSFEREEAIQPNLDQQTRSLQIHIDQLYEVRYAPLSQGHNAPQSNLPLIPHLDQVRDDNVNFINLIVATQGKEHGNTNFWIANEIPCYNALVSAYQKSTRIVGGLSYQDFVTSWSRNVHSFTHYELAPSLGIAFWALPPIFDPAKPPLFHCAPNLNPDHSMVRTVEIFWHKVVD